MATERRWVLAFDKDTGEHTGLTVCDIGEAKFYEAKYQVSGYDVRILTPSQVQKLVEQENCDS